MSDLGTDLVNQELNNKELLKQINEAISAVATTGISYKIGSRSVTRANISELKRLRSDLMQEIQAESNNNSLLGGASVAFFEGR